MKAMILAAGRGERMRPLTDHCPKPLLKVAGTSLIEHHINNLVAAGITEIVINHAWLGEQIVQQLGDGGQFGASICYSKEPIALETAGGIIKALALLAADENEVFLVLNGDIYCDFDFHHLPELKAQHQAHLFLVTNPEHNLAGDFTVQAGILTNPQGPEDSTYTFSGIALYRKSFFSHYHAKRLTPTDKVQPLAPMLRSAAKQGKISASVIDVAWTDVGTPERLARLNTK
ncbi:MurNAc alpha-1-phosphate uridylyltransferase [Colwellia chukchiensis]|uniref:MurNAc alpha-1-phosphate uridylyltransferase n=1 Tax=Colwellia chukchiensis TaxID=641665 RepID=A0A1H7JM69_9GAMM|nr:nucleotidyltransferase family protein [Colwellia chukchiensis]SEK75748.1 MurNAc alpha-1-phosphate uridylyltransferase [Colwellia chukchiensis]